MSGPWITVKVDDEPRVWVDMAKAGRARPIKVDGAVMWWVYALWVYADGDVVYPR